MTLLLTLGVLLVPALAGPVQRVADPGEVAEEIFVFGDPFARWDGTRWLVRTELMVPIGMRFTSDANEAFWTHAFQVRAVLACDKDERLGKRRYEVNCKLEDVAVQATTRSRFRSESGRAMVQRVLDQIDAKLTGAALQLQVRDDGSVGDVDLEGLETTNRRESQMAETLRQVVSRIALGFHMRIPDGGNRAGRWAEYKSALMSLPSVQASMGSSTVMHYVSDYKGHKLVQSIGEGSVSVPIPVQDTGSEIVAADVGESSSDSVPDMSSGVGGVSGGNVYDVDATFDLALDGVAIYDPDTGIMEERVWSLRGSITAGSPGTGQQNAYTHSGKILLLAPDDRPDLGPTRQLAVPGRSEAGLVPWASIQDE